MDQASFVERLTHLGHVAARDLDDLVARLARHADVAGMVVWGSGAAGALKPSSDLDLLLVWHAAPPLSSVTTWLGATLTELYAVSLDDVRAVVAGIDLSGKWDADLIVAALHGRILLDPDGVLAEAAGALRDRALSVPSAAEAFESWRHTQYNVRQTRRYLASPDEDARLAVEARLLYSIHDLLIHYFELRGMRWRGDKEALRYWRQHEPALRADWHAAVRETDVDRKVVRYEAMYDRVYAPLGGAAPTDLDLVRPGSAVTGDDAPEQALRAWNDLLAE